MNINVTQDKENRLLGRREVAFTAEYDGKTPTKEEVREGICKKLNLNPESTEVVRIDQLYGHKSSSIMVYSYSSREQMQKLAPKAKEKKGAAPAAPKPAAPAKEEKKPENKEAQKEEKKEENNEAQKEEKNAAPKDGKKE